MSLGSITRTCPSIFADGSAKTVHKIRNPVLYTFASPRVGDPDFVNVFNSLSLTSWRIVNTADIVPRLPPGLFFRHVNAEQTYDSSGAVRPSIRCRHAMTTYLHLIDAALPLDAKCQLAKRKVASDSGAKIIGEDGHT